MSILINENTKLVVQGITGRDGGFHASKMKSYGTKVVAGVSPGKEGTTVEGVPVFNTVENAVKATGANTSVIFVPAGFAADAIAEASEAGIKLVIAITEGIPTIDVIRITPILEKNGTKMIGPNCPGLISPGKSMVGILPTMIFKQGNVGLISRSGTLTYEMVNQLSTHEIGQSTCIGIGGDPVIGLHYRELLALFEGDKDTDAIVLCGEIGGDAEEQAAAFIKDHITKPVVAFIAGQSAPAGKRMGHAGALITSGTGTASEKIKAFEAAGVRVAKEPAEVPDLIKKAFAK
ncbi:MAG TPA: succinate--CoA ligase subunit alpha [Marinilabiliales bacterium]|jgi:succinyl-CoA synthetase alpha subunit|nr:succinate--CoA ligase subunit alpha [Salinivirgaceae bacterium]OFX45595.1 MAG: succinate--CoA ligase subunit alpha [Bacteroidetes bacterium GWA2_40_14]OFX56767.1 MAG: succinate--CoA ligase subunit alpha [Bacteroidetes bacterium GWC2_40_13]OFX72864.1 MAG: succinate--CoA ligase subunit alpha [Bacteroidetes bacterium GWD2_40_43]OFX93557.1 MAG: succinate--CoA ligase subunit alpha [Bacteroidetes bacterium GWE2_40_63]OFY18293.1 MAG: succinate--CoA ligase subunit alpha [Bacteroidetes bacterium GWF